MCVCVYICICKYKNANMQVHVVDMAPGCRTIFMLMSADGEYSFENTLHFSWGSLSPMHVTVSHLKAMIRLLPGDPLWGELCMTVSNLTICLFRAFWSHFNDISKCFMDKYRIWMKNLSTYALNLCLCNWDSVAAASSSHLRSRILSIEKSFVFAHQ